MFPLAQNTFKQIRFFYIQYVQSSSFRFSSAFSMFVAFAFIVYNPFSIIS